MPAAKSNPINELIAKRKLRTETRDKKAEMPKGGSLPPGIEGGIARVTMIKFPVAKSGQYQGQPMLYSHASVIEPEEVETFNSEGKSLGMRKIAGLMCQFRSINICDTKTRQGVETSLEENWAKAENHLKLLGIPTEDIDDNDFQEVVTAYPETEDLFVRFRTWIGEATKEYPNPQVNVVLEGPAEGYVQEVIDDMDDATEEAPKAKPKASKPLPAPKTSKPGPKPKATKPAPTKPKADAEPDLDALAAAADDDDDGPAQEELTRLAAEAGVDISEVETWMEGANMIREASSTTEGGEEGYEDVDPPEVDTTKEYKKDDIVMYTPPKSKKPVECEIARVIKGKRTANLVELDDDSKEYKNVSWDALSESE